MKRRTFIRDSSLLAISVGVFGKIKWDGRSYVGEDPTTTDILGPFYRPGRGVQTVYLVVLGSGYQSTANDDRLGVHLAVHRRAEQLPERG